MSADWRLLQGDARAVLTMLPAESVHCCVTSPPFYGLRDYGCAEQIGLEETPEEYVAQIVAVFREVRRLLSDDGTLWLNLGDSYATGGGKVGSCPGGGDQGERWTGYRGTREGSTKHAVGAIGPMTQPNRMPLPGLKPKDLIGIPWMVAFALRADGWYLRSEIIWAKPNPMPESVTDRPTKSHEQLFLLAKQPRYYFDAEAIRERSIDPPGISRGGSLSRFGRSEQLVSANGHRETTEPCSSGFRNRRSVWTIGSEPFPGAHFATMPTAIVKPCILAGCPVGGTVLDPFAGSGTTGAVAISLGRSFIGVELNLAYCEMARKRISGANPPLPLYEETTHAQ